MNRIVRTAAALAAAASLAAVAAAPASADGSIPPPQPPCDSVPGCVNYTLTTVDNLRQYVDDRYNDTVQPEVDWAACEVYYVVTGIRCTS